jgi:hypothetical protein
MNAFLMYLFWPNPGSSGYANPKALALLVVCVVLIAGALAVSTWRSRQSNPRMKRLSRSWSVASFWFGFVGLLLVVARVEEIQFLAMRFLWVLWAIAAVLYILLQVKLFRARFYEELPIQRSDDPRQAYLPKRKRRS